MFLHQNQKFAHELGYLVLPSQLGPLLNQKVGSAILGFWARKGKFGQSLPQEIAPVKENLVDRCIFVILLAS